jgi:hypothetical protein
MRIEVPQDADRHQITYVATVYMSLQQRDNVPHTTSIPGNPQRQLVKMIGRPQLCLFCNELGHIKSKCPSKNRPRNTYATAAAARTTERTIEEDEMIDLISNATADLQNIEGLEDELVERMRRAGAPLGEPQRTRDWAADRDSVWGDSANTSAGANGATGSPGDEHASQNKATPSSQLTQKDLFSGTPVTLLDTTSPGLTPGQRQPMSVASTDGNAPVGSSSKKFNWASFGITQIAPPPSPNLPQNECECTGDEESL